MNTLSAIGKAWDAYCRRLCPEEAGALWCLVSMAGSSRVRGTVVARLSVFAAAWNMGDTKEAELRAESLLQALRRKGAVTVSCSQGDGLVVTLSMFADRFERMRERERQRHRKEVS